MRKYTAVVIGAILLGFLTNMPLWAADNIKNRMKARLPQIDALKAQAVVGENNQGFLEFRGAATQKELINAENADRKKVYRIIAQQQGVSPELVGKRRAVQIQKLARPGEWLQDNNGQWYRK